MIYNSFEDRVTEDEIYLSSIIWISQMMNVSLWPPELSDPLMICSDYDFMSKKGNVFMSKKFFSKMILMMIYDVSWDSQRFMH